MDDNNFQDAKLKITPEKRNKTKRLSVTRTSLLLANMTNVLITGALIAFVAGFAAAIANNRKCNPSIHVYLHNVCVYISLLRFPWKTQTAKGQVVVLRFFRIA